MASLANQPPKKAIRNPGDSTRSHGNRNSSGQTVKFVRRTSSGRYVSLSRDELDMSGEISRDYMHNTVHLPRVSDNQPMGLSVDVKAEEEYVPNSPFNAGFMDKVIELEVCHPHLNGAKGSVCSMPTCDGNLMKDDRGDDLILCDCRYVLATLIAS